jgi:hypothetical protein
VPILRMLKAGYAHRLYSLCRFINS